MKKTSFLSFILAGILTLQGCNRPSSDPSSTTARQSANRDNIATNNQNISKRELKEIFNWIQQEKPAPAARKSILQPIIPRLFKAPLINLDSGPNENKGTNEAASLEDFLEGLEKTESSSSLKTFTELILKQSPYQDENSSLIPSNLEQMFSVLLNNLDQMQDDLAFDALLVRFVSIKALTYNRGSRSDFEEQMVPTSLRVFFAKRIEYLTDKTMQETEVGDSARSEKASDILNTFGELTVVFSETSWLTESRQMRILINAVDSNRLMTSGRRLQRKAALQLMTTSESQSPGTLKRILEIADDVLLEIANSYPLNLENIRWMNAFNLFIDTQTQKINSLEAAIELLDKRDEMNRDLSKSIEKRYKEAQDIKTQSANSHPLVDIAIERGLQRARKKALTQSSSLSAAHSIQNKIDILSKLDPSLSLTSYADLTAMNLTGLYQTLVVMSEKDRIRLYHSGLLAIHFGRARLLDGFEAKASSTVEEYKSLRKVLEATLCNRYLRKLEGIGCKAMGSMHGADKEGVGVVNKISDLSKEEQPVSGIMKVRLSDSTIVGAGIYFADYDTVIDSKSIRFHPLSMIYTQGFNIQIDAQSVEGAWIDSSGYDQIQDTPNPPIDGVPSQPNGTEGRAPSKPVPADSGTKGGHIKINGSSTESILVSFGGNGENGFHGANSPLCDASQVYREVIHSRVVVIGSRPKDCDKCKVEICAPLLGCYRDDICKSKGQRAKVCGSTDITEVRRRSLHVAAGAGGDGGNGGPAGQISLPANQRSDLVFTLSLGGRAGTFGVSGQCGPNQRNGQPGNEGLGTETQIGGSP